MKETTALIAIKESVQIVDTFLYGVPSLNYMNAKNVDFPIVVDIPQNSSFRMVHINQNFELLKHG